MGKPQDIFTESGGHGREHLRLNLLEEVYLRGTTASASLGKGRRYLKKKLHVSRSSASKSRAPMNPEIQARTPHGSPSEALP